MDRVLVAAGLVLGEVSGVGRVTSQDPLAGELVARGARVGVDLAPSGPRARVVVPELAGRTIAEARVALAPLGLVLATSAGDAAVVASQRPRAGMRVRRGGTVHVRPAPPEPTRWPLRAALA
ncbi:MAG: PASTA domain-containing protein, partial [Actinomycetota bacterium]|nr:PASTA domain-containing protein [Actinomycetota bacterium]